LATSRAAEGRRLLSVAADSDGKVNGALEIYSEQRHQQTAPIELTPRGGTTTNVTVPAQNQPSTQETPQSPN
jgi:hypothetical protein